VSPGVGYNYPHQNLTRHGRRKEQRMEIIALDAHKRYSQVCVQWKKWSVALRKEAASRKGANRGVSLKVDGGLSGGD